MSNAHDIKKNINKKKSIDTAHAQKSIAEIDALFNVAKKRKLPQTESHLKTTGKKSDKVMKAKAKERKAALVSDSDDDDPEVDPYYEFLEDELDERDMNSDGATYGMINNVYNPNKIVNPEAPLERIQDGLPVYKAHLLKVGEGGGTPLCPFDCNCCF